MVAGASQEHWAPERSLGLHPVINKYMPEALFPVGETDNKQQVHISRVIC